MESRVSGNAHARFGVGENPEVVRQRITYHYRTNLPHPPISIARGDRLTWNSASAEASGKATKMQRFTSTVS